MRRLFVMIIVAAAAWYGWKHYKELRQGPASEVVVENQSSIAMERVRIVIDDDTTIRDAIEPGQRTTVTFRPAKDGGFGLHWNFRGRDSQQDWTGGTITAGPLRVRHHLQVDENGGVVWSSERILSGKP